MIDDCIVDIGTACLCVAARRQDLVDSSGEIHQCNIVGPASEIEDHDFNLLVRLVQIVCKACRVWFVDYSVHFEAGDLTRVLRCLALVIVEVRRNGDDRLLYWSSEKCLSVPLDLLEYERGYLLRSVIFPVDAYLVVPCHLLLDFLNRSLGVGGGLSLRRLSNNHLTIFCERDYRGEHLASGCLTLPTGDD